jgi:hypothetical protein
MVQARCRKSLFWITPLLVIALVGWGGMRRAEATTPSEALDLSWSAEAACADGVDVAALEAPDWAVEPAATPADPAKDGGKSCTVNAQCKGKRQYCAKGVGDCKGKGSCKTKPEICPLFVKPVCGCNGKTYSNECFAAMAGVNVKSEGACQKPKGGTYTCKTNKECPAGDFCAKDMGKCADEGVCARRPVVCVQAIVAPVCGCNKKTYGNVCLAHSAGVSVEHDGKCEK